jgi:prepilin-type N-terminal cleavage/methylation domain-containing protein/prepilin-type processing-associated H-X9-DG protein
MRQAFTLIELLVVIAVIALLAAFAVPVALNYQEKSRAAACMSNLRTLGSALNLYLADNSAIMPTLKLGRERLTEDVPVIDNTLNRYAGSRRAFACPSDHRFATATGTSYHWNVAINGQALASLNFMGLADQPGRIPVMGDKEGFHRDPDHKVNILYADGHASKELTFAQQR